MNHKEQNHKERNLLNKRDAVIIVLLLTGAAVWLFLPGLLASGQNGAAVITCDNCEIARLSLDTDGVFTYPETGHMVFTVSEGCIAVTSSGCGDLTCVRTGSISRPGEAIVCVPNRTTVTVEGIPDGESLDVVLQ